MRRAWKKLSEENAGAMVENVIILPLLFIIIYSLILTIFIVHDRSTVETAASRGAIYASHCVSDPNYATIVGQSGELDMPADKTFSFSGVGKNIDAYRYIFGGDSIENQVRQEVIKIVDNTRISWRPLDTVEVSCNQENMFLYQDVTVSVTANYSIPAFFAAFGLETDYEYTATAKVSATDPDEFIRNADLVVDLITRVDESLGSPVGKALDKISTLADKILGWLQVDK